MNKYLAKFLSVIAHPVFINLLCLYLLFLLFPSLSHGLPTRIQLFFISFIFISTSIIPILIVLAMRVLGKINSITLETNEERKLPYLVTLALYVFNYYNFLKSPTTDPIILQYLLACAAIIGSVAVINFFNKISIHMATLGALCGLLATVGFIGLMDIRIALILTVLFSGLIGSARISLKAHLPNQVYFGFVLGFILMFVVLNFPLVHF